MGSPRRPNILVLMADQMVPAALPFHGDRVARTPALSRLADEGVVFENAYTASPLCAPARASLLTGLLPSRTGTYDNAADFSSQIPTVAHYLRGRDTARCWRARCTSADRTSCTASRSG